MSIRYAQMLIKRGGGVVACGEHLGVFVGHPDNVKQTPAGWTFVDVTTATPELLSEAIANSSNGRSTWPDKVLDGTVIGRPGTRKPNYGLGSVDAATQARGGR